MYDSVQPHRQQPTSFPCPWDSPGKNTGVGCHFLLQCMKVKSESEVAQTCPALSDPMDCSLPGPSNHGIFQARVLEWGAIAFSIFVLYLMSIKDSRIVFVVSKIRFGKCAWLIIYMLHLWHNLIDCEVTHNSRQWWNRKSKQERITLNGVSSEAGVPMYLLMNLHICGEWALKMIQTL